MSFRLDLRIPIVNLVYMLRTKKVMLSKCLSVNQIWKSKETTQQEEKILSRYNCDNPGSKTKARYWSCYQWRGGAKVDTNVNAIRRPLERCRDPTVACFIMMKLSMIGMCFGHYNAQLIARISTALIVGFLVGIFCCGVRILQFYYWDKSLIHDVFMLGVMPTMADMIIHIDPLWKYCILIGPLLTGTLAAIIFYVITHIKRKI